MTYNDCGSWLMLVVGFHVFPAFFPGSIQSPGIRKPRRQMLRSTSCGPKIHCFLGFQWDSNQVSKVRLSAAFFSFHLRARQQVAGCHPSSDGAGGVWQTGAFPLAGSTPKCWTPTWYHESPGSRSANCRCQYPENIQKKTSWKVNLHDVSGHTANFKRKRQITDFMNSPQE